MQRKLGDMEQRFADLIWEKEPIRSGELVLLCEEEFDWKKSTTYTMLKRLCDDGIFVNRDSVVEAKIKKQDFLALEGESLINKSFNGSLPQFLAAFTRRNKLSDKEIDEIQKLIDNHKEG